MNTELDLLNTDYLDESILNNTFDYSNADGESEFEDEENTDSELSDEEGVSEEELPKFRTLVKNKKLEMKAQYGKARIVTERKCNKGIPYPCPTIKEPLKVCYKEVCANVPKFQSGWRKKWREFKQAGGLSQLKLQARGLAPIPTTVTASAPTKGLMFRGKLLGAPIKTTLGKVSDLKTTDESKSDNSDKRVAEESNDKILGMPKPLGITVAIIGSLALVVGGFFFIKKIAK